MNIVKIREGAPSLRNVVAQMRQLADSIEAGNYGVVNACALVLDSDDIEVFAWGDLAEAGPNAHLLLHVGAAKMVQRVLDEKS